MPIRLRKLIGLILLLAWLFVYALIAMGVAVRMLPGAHWAVELFYYAAAGLAWIFPARLIIGWMSRAAAPSRPAPAAHSPSEMRSPPH